MKLRARRGCGEQVEGPDHAGQMGAQVALPGRCSLNTGRLVGKSGLVQGLSAFIDIAVNISLACRWPSAYNLPSVPFGVLTSSPKDTNHTGLRPTSAATVNLNLFRDPVRRYGALGLQPKNGGWGWGTILPTHRGSLIEDKNCKD